MTTSFGTTALTYDRFLIEGTDSKGTIGKTVVNGGQFLQLKDVTKDSAAHEAFDKAVEKFYAPITKAVAALEAAHIANAEDLFTEVIQPAVQSISGQPAITVRLEHETVVLRLIEAGDYDRLIWVGDSLEITAA